MCTTMKSTKSLHLVYLVLIISLTSCSEVDTLQEPITEDAKPLTETSNNNSVNEGCNLLTVDEASLLLGKNESDISIEILELINIYHNSLG